jgi:hypothetical protein
VRGTSVSSGPTRNPISSLATPLTVVRLITSRTPAHRGDLPRQLVDGRERLGAEHVAEDADDRGLLAAEDRLDRLVIAPVRIVGGQQILDRRVDADPRREDAEDERHHHQRQQRQPWRAQRASSGTRAA